MPAPVRRTPLALVVLSLLENGPMHPYGLQRMIRDWGKDQVVNVGQRTSLYRVIDRLDAAGLVGVVGTERDERYPERTVYQLTDLGKRTAREWLIEIIGSRRNEYPEFPAALSFLMVLPASEAAELLDQRRAEVDSAVETLQGDLASEIEGYDLPRVALLETEFQLAIAKAERDWLAGVVADLRTGVLAWDPETLKAPPIDQ